MNLPSTIFLLNILIGTFEISIQMKGGLGTLAGYFPFQVLIMRLGQTVCNGGIIDATHVLTAARCVTDPRQSSYAVIAGRLDLSDSVPQWRGVKKILLHPDFETHYMDDNSSRLMPYFSPPNDIAVLTLIYPLSLTETVMPMRLASNDCENVDSCQICMIAGWESIKEPSPIGVHLMSVSVQVLSFQDSVCRGIIPGTNEFGFEDDTKLMVLSSEDYGAPLLCRGYIVGILISTIATSNYPSVLLAVAPYSAFINQAVKD